MNWYFVPHRNDDGKDVTIMKESSQLGNTSLPYICCLVVNAKVNVLDERRKTTLKRFNPTLHNSMPNLLPTNKDAELYSHCHEVKKNQRIKGQVYLVKGVMKRWDGRRFIRCCIAPNCRKLAQGSTLYCKQHFYSKRRVIRIKSKRGQIVHSQFESLFNYT